MSKQSPQQPDPTPVLDPQSAGSPAANPAGDALPPPGAPATDLDDLASPLAEADRLDVPHERRTAPRLTSPPRHGKRLVPATDVPRTPFTPQQRLLILDSWSRSGLPAGDFAPLVGLSKHTLYAWKRRFNERGPAGLTDQPRGGPSV